MSPHPVVRTVRRQLAASIQEMPRGSIYDAINGVWLIGAGLVARDPRFALMTKKKDVESGEDVKGS